MFKVGQFFQSARALIRCHSAPIATPDGIGGYTLGVDAKQLIPNNFGERSDRITSQFPVWVDGQKLGMVNCLNTDENRANSLWRLTQVNVDGAGCGNGHHISGKESAWARFNCVAVRVNTDGTPHESGETITFSSAGSQCVMDLKFVSLSNCEQPHAIAS